MPPLVIHNGKAGDRQHDQLKEALLQRGYNLVDTEYVGHGTRLACEAADQGIPLIIAAGGDGTVSEVAAGVLRAKKKPTMAIIPMGTGNDLCRSLDMSGELEDILVQIERGRTIDMDVAVLDAGGSEHTFFNVSACGFAGTVDKHLDEIDKASWGPLSYIRSGIAALAELEPFHVDVVSGEEVFSVDALNIVVGNGRYAASGIPVAPQAILTDGMLDVVLYMGKSITDQIFNSRLILAGEQDRSDTILSLRAPKFAMKFSRPLSINYDGELLEKEIDEVIYSVHPKRLRMIVGENYS